MSLAINLLIEACQKGCIALIPVVIFRRWRYGGKIRPAEALPIYIGLPQLFFSISRSAIFGLYDSDRSSPTPRLLYFEAIHLSLLSQIALGLLAATLVAIHRRRLADWLTGVLVVLAYSRITEAGGFFFQEWANERIATAGQSMTSVAVRSAFVVQWPLMTLGLVPLAAAVLDFRRLPRHGRSWVEWAGMFLGASTLALIQARIVFHDSLGSRSRFATVNSLHLTMLLAAIVTSFRLVRWFGPPVRRFLFVDDLSHGTAPRLPTIPRFDQRQS